MTPEAPRVLIVHGETLGCAGAQRVLAYFLEGASGRDDLTAAVAMAPNSKLAGLLPSSTRVFPLPANQRFTLAGFLRQAAALRRLRRDYPFRIVHGWTARDWELTSAAALVLRLPGVGSLHEHPHAGHVSPRRRLLMKATARAGLARVLCVSGAVAAACREAGYPADRLRVVHNGLPDQAAPPPPDPQGRVRLGYLGILDESKGLSVLFDLVARLEGLAPGRWELRIGGGSIDAAGEAFVRGLTERWRSEPWWRRVEWVGWVSAVADFMRSIDLLVMPSTSFDAFPTVLLEAAQAARPVFAHRIGGVPEIVAHGESGWLFESRDMDAAAASLAYAVLEPGSLTRAGAAAAARIRREFRVDLMVEGYLALYRELTPAR